MALPEGRLVPWKGYAERLAHGTEEGNTLCCSHSWSVWRCEIWTEGLFSLLFWALGFLESSVGRAEERFLIDWTDERILFHGSGQLGYSSNAWNHFFEQPGGDPPKLKEKLGECQEAGRLKIVVRFGPPWFQKFGEFRGADEGDGPFREIKGGRLDEATAELGRQAVRRWVRVRPAILHRAEEWLNEHSEGGRRLAVHLRRTDKLEQCRSNDLPLPEILSQILAFCRSLECSSVLLCTDDATMKKELWRQLHLVGLETYTFDALLSIGGPSHKDENLDRRRNAEDVLVEVLLMSRCHALLSTSGSWRVQQC
ncbi:Uncharacterized protein SCF082_LOCUS35778 [Durusdinium trenchii]|uniref:O-fucosyltransferase family protein n=1 Tax=Durusdinium trenchii TaxID=1381693 RepID=A0ABP0PDU6_9DINO